MPLLKNLNFIRKRSSVSENGLSNYFNTLERTITMYEKGYRTVTYSRTEATHLLRYVDINGQNRLFGGKLLEWIDEIAGIAAMRHASMNVAT